MTGKQRMIRTLSFEPTDRPPHFENMFQLEHEAFGLRFPEWGSWANCTAEQKQRQIDLCMDIYGRIIERFRWDALMVFFPWADPDGLKAAQKHFGSQVLIGAAVGGGLWCIDTISDWGKFAEDLYERPEHIHAEAERRCASALAQIDLLTDAGAEFIVLVHDVAFNAGPFCSPKQFEQIVTPYLARLVDRVKQRGAWAIVHSDGMLMPVLETMLSTQPHMLHSIDPQAGMDIAEVRRITLAKRIGIMGNVECRLLQDGPDEKIRESTLYCLQHCAAGSGHVFSTSNTIFPGMPLANYEYMLKVFHDYVGS